ncbi:hypothetical protein [Lonepinella koalarum]|uniref:Uncharacterized protein n=1 Tax=Lonepinella koalarum TaxID=53417 RepID=A0A4R1KXG4_9PAST|nr:hypothetical protein [Lonepinella koalarum]MDH2927888.1 hypothetical protein [Lonepinella koalarum]TCK70082.1 hypothetical protein EV692_1308 [Lonepinella koalarum]TFJ90321.1 hypothetical protein E0709_02980 [Lonepinella koalarum]
MANLQVEFATQFKHEFKNLPTADKDKITHFVEHILTNGFIGLEGKNKSSNDVNFNDANYVSKIEYARKYRLWHYHIGIIQYDLTKPYGRRTSEYVLHYQRLVNMVRIVDLSAHPPFRLPTKDYLK